MKPIDFDYARPATLAEATGLLAREAEGAKVVAGAQSLGPMLNLRLVQPDLLVDITALPELLGTREEAGYLVVGAAVTHASLEDSGSVEPTMRVLARVAHGIAYRAVRNRGTIGGSLAHADPAADWLVTLTALGAELRLKGEGVERTIPLMDFVVGAFETALAPGELIVSVRVPKLSADARFGYYKVCRRTGEFADASAAVLIDPARDVARSVIGATSGRPIVLEGANGAPREEIERRVIEAFSATALAHDPLSIAVHGAALQRAFARAAA